MFFESYNRQKFEAILGRPANFVQDNYSMSHRGVLRGLHFQEGEDAQAKLIRVINGSVLDVVVDLRPNSPTFGKHFKTKLSGEKPVLLFIPRGMAHGFLALEDQTVFAYKCDNYYAREAESGIHYADPELGINWGYPEDELIISEKDRNLPGFKELYP